MQIDHYIVWYNGMGGSPLVSFVGDYLLAGWPGPFGAGFDTIEIYAHVPAKQVDATLADLARRFEERTLALPKCWMKRKKRLIEVAYNSKLGFAEDLIENCRRTPLVAEFRLACCETIGVLQQARERFNQTDGLSIDDMLNFFQHKHEAIPETQDQFSKLFVRLREDATSRLAP